MLGAFIVSISAVTEAQLAVKVRPEPPVLLGMPIAPSPKHVWVSGEWVRRGDNYFYVDGHWTRPPFRYHRWIEGHWKNTRRGWVWKAGHWK